MTQVHLLRSVHSICTIILFAHEDDKSNISNITNNNLQLAYYIFTQVGYFLT